MEYKSSINANYYYSNFLHAYHAIFRDNTTLKTKISAIHV